jgi:hypothetical protein
MVKSVSFIEQPEAVSVCTFQIYAIRLTPPIRTRPKEAPSSCIPIQSSPEIEERKRLRTNPTSSDHNEGYENDQRPQ